ncbi:MAG: hypothetical protein V3T33_04920 [Myxococcota bacterium]
MDGELEHPGQRGEPGVHEREARDVSPPILDAMLPVPAGPPRRQQTKRPGFWKRITIRNSVRRAQALVESNPYEPVLLRLDKIEGQLSAIEDAVRTRFRLERVEQQLARIESDLADRFERLDHHFLQFWEIEERLGRLDDIQVKMDELGATQSELMAWAAWLRRGIVFSAFFFLAAAVFTVYMLSQ